MAFWFGNDRKYEKDTPFYTTFRPNCRKEMPFLKNPNLLEKNGPKLSCMISPEADDEEVLFLKQMGVTHTYTWLKDHQSNRDTLSKLVMKLTKYDITLHTVGSFSLGKNPDIILGGSERDDKINKLKAFLLLIKEVAGVRTSIFTWEPNGVFNTHFSRCRGGSLGRSFDVSILEEENKKFEGKLYTESELWYNMEYFLKEMVPFLEKHDMVLALHPNDPPVALIRGVPAIIRSKQAFDRVFRLANDSQSIKMEFCVGTWLEGGTSFCSDLLSALKTYTAANKITKVHLRNVSAPLPSFVETYLDGGYGDIYSVVRTLVGVGYDGTIILDHTPPFVEAAGPGSATAFSLGLIKAFIRAAQAERRIRSNL